MSDTPEVCAPDTLWTVPNKYWGSIPGLKFGLVPVHEINLTSSSHSSIPQLQYPWHTDQTLTKFERGNTNFKILRLAPKQLLKVITRWHVWSHTLTHYLYLIVMWRQLVEELSDPVLLSRAVDIRHLLLWQTGEIHLDLHEDRRMNFRGQDEFTCQSIHSCDLYPWSARL